MLLGRFLQERQLEKNRRLLLEGEDASSLLTRRLSEKGRSELTPVTEIERGDRLVVMPGDLFPVDARIEHEAACSLDWINGESRPRTFAKDDVVPAGAFSCASAAVIAHAETAFSDSTLLDLLRTPLRSAAAGRVPFWEAITKRYVIGVLVLAVLGFVVWFALTRDGHRALAVSTAVLVVTCPCAFGIATPLAYDLAHARLRQAGLFVRTPDFLDRAAMVECVAFDKTGTLTRGSLRLANREAIDALDEEQRRALATLASRSGHPKAVAIDAALDARPFDVVCEERTGDSITCHLHGSEWRLGRGEGEEVVFSRDGRALARFRLIEELRDDARQEIAELFARGLDVSILSGDAPERVAEIARAVDVSDAHGNLSPWDKAAYLASHDKTLMIGDGVNDLVAAEKAFCSGTPAIDRPFVASRSDFYFVTPGLRPIRLALDLAKRLRRVVRRNLQVALVYNALAVGLALAGRMSPLVCAVIMPLSSLSTVAVTVFSLRRDRWM
jgi:Cu2+-exporting ATPase